MKLRGTRELLFASALLLAVAPNVEADQSPDSSASKSSENPSESNEDLVSRLGNYQQILLRPVDLGYTAGFSKDAWNQRHRVGSRDLERIRRYFQEIAEERLAGSRPMATQPGPGVLRVDPILVDAVVDKSAWLAPARDVFKKRDKVMLLAVLRDSQTEEIIHRVLIDARPFGNVVLRQDPLTYWDDMRHLLRLLATRVQWVLEAQPHSSAIASLVPTAES